MAAGDDVDGAGVWKWREVGTLPGKGVEIRKNSWSGCVWWGNGELDELNSFDVIPLPSRRLAATNLRPASQDARRSEEQFSQQLPYGRVPFHRTIHVGRARCPGECHREQARPWIS